MRKPGRSCLVTSNSNNADPVDLAALRALLTDIARVGETRTYQQVAQALNLEPPQTIHRLTVALERLMDEDVTAGRPLLAAVVISRTRDGLPAPGFFAHARKLGRYNGPEKGSEAAAFHKAELALVQKRKARESARTDTK